MKRLNAWITLTLAALLLAPAVLLAAGGSSAPAPPSGDPAASLTPEQNAMLAYNDGLEYREKAWKLEEEIAAGDPKAEKKAMKVGKAYKKAIGQFRKAVEQVPNFHQAWSSLGYALRKTGQYQESLEAYDRSLAIDPRYPEAIEYRAEAYLGLNRINEAQNAYRLLLDKNEELAAELLGSMRGWIEARREDLAGLELDQLDGFARWVEDREQQASGSSLHKGGW